MNKKQLRQKVAHKKNGGAGKRGGARQKGTVFKIQSGHDKNSGANKSVVRDKYCWHIKKT